MRRNWRRTHHYGMRLGKVIRSTMPPLKRKITVGSPKNLAEFVGGPWDRMRGKIPSTVRTTEGIRIGTHRGRYVYNGLMKSYGRKNSGPAYMQFEWKGEYLWND